MSMVERILSRGKELGLSPRAISLKAGLNPTFVRDLVRRPSASPSIENARKLATALGTTVEWLTDAPKRDMAHGEHSERADAKGGSTESAFVQASYGGTVEAGAFRPVEDYEDPDREPIFVPRDPQFPQAPLFVFDVAGDSMNDLRPHPLLPGSRLVCMAIEATRIPYRDGMVVVIEQTINGGQLRERSVKQVQVYEDRIEFWPRSKNPRHKPIIVLRDRTADDGVIVAVIAIVRDVQHRIPLG